MNKIACILQGNIREGFLDVLSEMMKLFDEVILSTWDDEKSLPAGDYHLILNERPPNVGNFNRNLQRVSTVSGIKKAKELNCTHVLKWRTDLLPTRLNVDELIQYTKYSLCKGIPSRIVMSSFRNLSVSPDWFSSFPDLYAFGEIEMMELFWNDFNLDFSSSFHLPKQMIEDCELTISNNIIYDKNGDDITDFYDTHVECYALFRENLEKRFKVKLNHPKIALHYLFLQDHSKLRICWFGANGQFRPIAQAYHIPWWSENVWKTGKYQILDNVGYKIKSGPKRLIGKLKGKINTFFEKTLQKIYFHIYKRKN